MRSKSEVTPELRHDTKLASGLKRARIAAGIGQKQAGRLSGLNYTTVWRIEQGKIVPGVQTLLTLMLLYDANVNIGPDGLMVTWMEVPKADEDSG
jgi:transcriptional regulator with XRE-family HTH domain